MAITSINNINYAYLKNNMEKQTAFCGSPSVVASKNNSKPGLGLIANPFNFLMSKLISKIKADEFRRAFSEEIAHLQLKGVHYRAKRVSKEISITRFEKGVLKSKTFYGKDRIAIYTNKYDSQGRIIDKISHSERVLSA